MAQSYIDRARGIIYELEDDELGQAREYGLEQATPDEIQKYDDAKTANEAPTQSFLEMAGRSLAPIAGVMATAGGGDPNARFGGPQPEPVSPEPPPIQGAQDVAPSLYTPEAKSRARGYSEEHPFLAGIAQSTPEIAGGLLIPGVGGLAGAAAGVVAGGAVSGASQELEESWQQDREFSTQAALANGALNTVLGTATLGAGAALGAGVRRLAGRNLLAEAEGLADEVLGVRAQPRVARSAGAAAATDFEDDIVKAVEHLDDKEAATIAYDADHYRALITSQVRDKADEITEALDNDLAYKLKIDDWGVGAEEWTPAMVKRQGAWTKKQLKAAENVADLIKAAPEQGYRFKGAGAAALEDIEQHTARIAEVDGAARNAAFDDFKKVLDRRIAAVADVRDTTLDQATKKKLIGYLRSYSDDLRTGLEDSKLFGRNADLQAAVNPGWHKFIEPWSRVQKRIYEVTGKEWGEVGAGRVKRRANAGSIMSALAEDPTTRKAFDTDLRDALEGLDDLVRARDTYGYTRLENVDKIRTTLSDLKSEWNVGALIKKAEARAAELGKRPKILEALAEGFGDLVPGGALAKRVAAFGGKIQRGQVPQFARSTPLGRVMGESFQRWSKNADVEDPSIFRPDWLREMLGTYRAAAPQGGVPGAVAVPNPAAPRVTQPLSEEGKVTGKQATLGRAEATQLVDTAIANKSLQDLQAIPIDENDRATIEWLKADPAFRATGNVADSFARSKGGLPAFTIEHDGRVVLQNGRHRLAAARELGRDTIQGRLVKQGKRGAVLWEYEGPIRIGAGPVAAVAGLGAMGMAGEASAAPEPTVPDLDATRTNSAIVRVAKATRAQTARAVELLLTEKGEPEPMNFAHAQVLKRAEKLNVTPQMARFMGRKHTDPVEAYEAARDRLNAIAVNPAELGDSMAEAFGTLPRAQPEAFSGMVIQATRVARFLHQTMPRPTGRGPLNPEGYPPPLEDIQRWASQWVGATLPQDSIHDIAGGSATSEQLDAVRANWPSLFDEFQRGSLMALTERARRGPIPFHQLVYLDNVLGLEGAGDPMLSPEMGELTNQAEAASPQPPAQAPSSGSRSSGSTRSLQPAAMSAMQNQ